MQSKNMSGSRALIRLTKFLYCGQILFSRKTTSVRSRGWCRGVDMLAKVRGKCHRGSQNGSADQFQPAPWTADLFSFPVPQGRANGRAPDTTTPLLLQPLKGPQEAGYTLAEENSTTFFNRGRPLSLISPDLFSSETPGLMMNSPFKPHIWLTW